MAKVIDLSDRKPEFIARMYIGLNILQRHSESVMRVFEACLIEWEPDYYNKKTKLHDQLMMLSERLMIGKKYPEIQNVFLEYCEKSMNTYLRDSGDDAYFDTL